MLSGWADAGKGVQSCQWRWVSAYVCSRLLGHGETWCQQSRVFQDVSVPLGGNYMIKREWKALTIIGSFLAIYHAHVSIFKAPRDPASVEILIYPSIPQTNVAPDTSFTKYFTAGRTCPQNTVWATKHGSSEQRGVTTAAGISFSTYCMQNIRK